MFDPGWLYLHEWKHFFVSVHFQFSIIDILERYSFILFNLASWNNIRILQTLGYWEAYLSFEGKLRTTGLRPHVHVSEQEIVTVLRRAILLCRSRCASPRCLHERSPWPSSPLVSYRTNLVYLIPGVLCTWIISFSLLPFAHISNRWFASSRWSERTMNAHAFLSVDNE